VIAPCICEPPPLFFFSFCIARNELKGDSVFLYPLHAVVSLFNDRFVVYCIKCDDYARAAQQ
jgi:hypothetical protein